MSRNEEVELTNMCMICDGKGNVLVQNKVGNADWHGWNFPGGHVEKGEYITPSVVREMREETGLTIEKPKLCGIKEFHKLKDGKRYIVFHLLLKNLPNFGRFFTTKKVPDRLSGTFVKFSEIRNKW